MTELSLAALHAARLARQLAGALEALAALSENGSHDAQASDDADLAVALTALKPEHQAIIAAASRGELAETRGGDAARWTDLDDATAASSAATVRGRKRMISTISASAPCLAGVGWTVDPDRKGRCLIRVPEAVALVARRLWAARPQPDENPMATVLEDGRVR